MITEYVQRLSMRARMQIDARRGLDFLRTSAPDDGPAGVTGFSASSHVGLRQVLRLVNLHPADRLLDVGCAKGAALRVMATNPLSRLAGLEYSPTLCAIAEQNFHVLGRPDVEVIHADATTWSGYSDFSVLYAYNPLRPPYMAEFLRAVTRSLRPQHSMLLIYANPMGHKQVLESDLFHDWSRIPGFHGNPVHVYATTQALGRLPQSLA